MLVAAATAAAATDPVTMIELRSGARVSADQPIYVGDVARVSGPLSATINAIELAGEPTMLNSRGEQRVVSAQAVRDAVLDAAAEGSVAFQGTECVLMVRGAVRAASPAPDTHDVVPAKQGEVTVRDQIEAHLVGLFGTQGDEIRLRFEERDDELLGIGIDGRVVEVRPTGQGRRMPVSITVYEGVSIVVEGTVRVEIELRRRVAVAKRRLGRGLAINSDMITGEDRWVGLDDQSVSVHEIVGLVVRRGVDAGDSIERSMVEPPIVIRRGDVVVVRSVVGAAAIRVRARAMDDGRVGETGEFELERGDRRDRTRVQATVIGPGRAIVGVSNGVAAGESQ